MRLYVALKQLRTTVREYLDGVWDGNREGWESVVEHADATLANPYPVVEDKPDTPCECGNCEDVHTLADVKPWSECEALAQRLNIGSPLPAGECLKCGAWSYALTEDA